MNLSALTLFLLLLLTSLSAVSAQTPALPAAPPATPPGFPRQPPTASPQIPAAAAPRAPAAAPQTPAATSQLPAATPQTPAAAPQLPAVEDGNLISFTATPVSEVLLEYYNITGRKVLRDRGMENAVVTIDVPGTFSDEEYRSIIEKGLLMHGYALVPSGPDLFKLVASETGSLPSTQNVPMILRSEDLPDTDQVVTHVIQLNYLSAEDASSAFQTVIPLHPYGKVLAVPNSQSIIITEASQTIRAFLDLSKQVDLPPAATVQKTIKIQRADVEEVIEQLQTLLGLGGNTSTSSGRPASAARPSPAGGAPPGLPGGTSAPSSASLAGGSAGGTAVQPLMQAVPRTNSIIVIARPIDMQKIEALVAELDAEAPTSRYFSRKLNYLDLTTFLGIAEKALMRNDPQAGDSALASLQKSQQSSSSQQTNNSTSFGSGSSFGSGLGSNGLGSGSSLGGSSSLSGSGGLSNGFGTGGGSTDLQITKKPISILIANTLVIADPASSKFFASGPPDQIQALQDLADELDIRPRQILISAIIGQFTLGDNFNFGLDWIQSLKKVGDDGLVGGVLNTQGTAFANPSNLKDIAGFLGAGNPAALAGLTAYGQINKNLNVFLQTLESTKRFKVLQKPTVTALNHQSARIYIGQQIAIAGQSYTSGVVGGGFTSNTQYIPIRLQLDITPHIFNDTEVMLEFKQQNNDISGYTTLNGNQVPNISEQGLSNNLIVADQSTAMLGGLITERDTKNKSGLPFLMRIPMLKYLVGSTNNTKQRQEMIIFVQPRIMPDTNSHMLEQARFGDSSENYEDTAAFGGMPETIIPRGAPAAAKPNDLLPPPAPAQAAPAAPEPKKGFFSKMKGLFHKSKSE